MMRLRFGFLLAVAVLVVSVAPAHAWVAVHGFHGPHVFVGPRVFIGPDPFWYAYPYPTYPPVVVQPSPPAQVYVQPQQAPPAESYWYYCENPKGYYPYVSQCPGGWMRVVPGTKPPTP
jgi:hypothetical protein